MFNRPLSPWSTEPSAAEPGWNVDQNPQSRLVLLWLGMLIPVFVIGARVAHLQLGLQDEFANAFSLTTETSEEIPARDGRILAADGSVLADDARQFDLAVFYPALQNPPDDSWVTGKAIPRLSKLERRDKTRLAQEKQTVVEETERLWERLAELTDRPLSELQDSRQKVQERVQQIKESVHRRHRERQLVKEHSLADDKSSLWQTLWQRIRQRVEEPTESHVGPRLIAEEQDYHIVITNITAEMKDEIEAHGERFPFTRIRIRTRRRYPRHELAAHVIGYRKPLTEEQLQERQREFPDHDPLEYRVGDPCGLEGLERTYDAVLKGVRGRRVLTKNRRGEIVDTRIDRETRHGRDLNLTIDPELQLQAESLLKNALLKVTPAGVVDTERNHLASREPTCPKGGSIVALDIHTGSIVVAASAPGFDPNVLVGTDSAAWNDLAADPRGPLLSRITRISLPPGSVFKPITAIAALESGVVRAETNFFCQGYLDRPTANRCLSYLHRHVGHGDLALADALCRSCNVYFYTAARKMGPQTLVDWCGNLASGNARESTCRPNPQVSCQPPIRWSQPGHRSGDGDPEIRWVWRSVRPNCKSHHSRSSA